jgi:hypothetical protein
MTEPSRIWALGTRTKPAPVPGDNVSLPVHASRWGELVVQNQLGNTLYPLADEGSYYVVTNTTPGTGIAGPAAPTTFADTSALMYLYNGPNNGRLYLHYIMLSVTAAGTSGTNFAYVMRGDKTSNRYTSGGSALTPQNPNMGVSGASGVNAYFGALVLAAATSNVRTLDNAPLRTVLKVVGDKYLFTFGNATPGPVSGIPLEGTTQAQINVPCPPVVLDPGDSFSLHELAASQSVAASYELKMGFWVR